LLLRFLKGPGRAYDEDAAIEALQRGFPHLIDQVRTGRESYFAKEDVIRFDSLEAQRGWDVAKGAIASDLYSVVVLDELNPVLDLGLLPLDEVIRTLKNKPDSLEIIVTGRGTPQALLDIADLHSESVSHDHPASREQGIEGIEIYTGAGKGKSTNALGKALQAIGKGISTDASHRVLIMAMAEGRHWDHRRCGKLRRCGRFIPTWWIISVVGKMRIVWRGQQQMADYVDSGKGLGNCQGSVGFWVV
jgi:cob(I)alamin adenosyltransferase